MLLADDGELRPTIFAEMSALAISTGAINLGQGFPDEDGPEAVREAAKRAIDDGVNQYPPGRGIPVLREAIAAHQKRFYALTIDPDREVLVTAGATEGVAATLLALLDDGDEVITFEPFYDSYAAMIALAGGVQVTVPLRAPDFRPDLDQLRDAVTDRTRVILINSPHNPTGTVLDREALELIVELAHRHDAIIVADEVYDYFADAAATLAAKRELLSTGLRRAGFEVSRPDGSYFVIADAAPLGFDDAVELCRRLPELAGVVGIPLTAFVRPERHAGYRSMVRFAFCKRTDVLDRATAQLGNLRP
jgi:aspartate/methionine/tyrosine aminotransferase